MAVLHFRHSVEREAASFEIGRAKAFLHTIIENMPTMVSVKEIPTGRYVLLNKAAEDSPGRSARRGAWKKIGRRNPPEERAAPFLASDSEAIRSRDLTVIPEQSIETPQAGRRIISTQKLPILGENGEPRYLLSLAEDITERKRAEARIAHHGASRRPDRSAQSRRLHEHLRRHARRLRRGGRLRRPVPRPRPLQGGQRRVRPCASATRCCAMARRLRVAREATRSWRASAATNSSSSPTAATQPAAAEVLAERLLRRRRRRLRDRRQHLRIGLSIGIAIYPADGTDATTLLANADAALYRAKADGRGTMRFFEVEMDKRLRERRALAA